MIYPATTSDLHHHYSSPLTAFFITSSCVHLCVFIIQVSLYNLDCPRQYGLQWCLNKFGVTRPSTQSLLVAPDGLMSLHLGHIFLSALSVSRYTSGPPDELFSRWSQCLIRSIPVQSAMNWHNVIKSCAVKM